MSSINVGVGNNKDTAKSNATTTTTAKPAYVAFCCQQCGSPLKLDQSLLTSAPADKSLLREITSPLCHSDPTLGDLMAARLTRELQYSSTYSKHVLLQTSQADSDFTLLGTVDQSGVLDNLGHRIRVSSHLFDKLSSQAEIDHPLCEDCTDQLLDLLDQQLRVTEDECKGYKEFLENLESNKTQADTEIYDEQFKKLQSEEAELLVKIAQAEKECELLDKEISSENSKQTELYYEEAEYLKEYNELKRQVIAMENEERSAENQLKYAELQLERLVQMNAFNTTFHIWHSGHFGTINGFRLGRLPSVPVDWNEINTAWGQTVLLLHSLALKLNLRFDRYKLVPYGNHSYIESLTDKSRELPLYCAGGIRFFWDTKFDHAMVAFLDCLQQFKEEVEKGDSQFCLPYRMSNGKMEDASTQSSYSVKIQFNSEEQWTKALKFMLTNLRWGLTWVSSRFANSD